MQDDLFTGAFLFIDIIYFLFGVAEFIGKT
jgi:hypothetical protein